ncbi:MAG: hypothetical protein AAB110_07040, partial [Candidatus Desantisbacteria bacterium]
MDRIAAWELESGGQTREWRENQQPQGLSIPIPITDTLPKNLNIEYSVTYGGIMAYKDLHEFIDL